MKYFSIISSMFLLALWMYNPSVDEFPKPTPGLQATKVVVDMEEDENNELKEQWITGMHKAAPGVDWQKLDRDTRWSRRNVRGSKRSFDSTYYLPYANGKIYAHWQERGSDNQSGRITYADADTTDGLLYCVSQGGTVFRGTLTGKEWTPLNDYMKFDGASHIKSFHFNGVHRIMATASKYVYFSDDQGQNWQTASGISNVVSFGRILRTVVLHDSLNPVVLLLIQEWDYNNWGEIVSIYRSTDLASSFTKVVSYHTDASEIVNSFDLWGSYVIGSDAYFVKGTDLFSLSPGSTVPDTVGVIPVTPGSKVLLTGAVKNNALELYAYISGLIYYSSDTASNWTYMTDISKSPFRRNSFACSYSAPEYVFFGDYECHRSINNGSSWNKINNWYDYYNDVENKLHADIPAIIPWVDAAGAEHIYICTDGGLYVTDDLMSNVKNLSMKGLNASQLYSVLTNREDTNYIYAGTQDQGFQRSEVDSGGIIAFNQSVSGDYGHIVSTDTGSSIWFVYPGFIAFNEEAKFGVWDASEDFNGKNNFWIPPLMADPDDKFTAYMAGKLINGTPAIYKAFTVSGSNNISLAPMPATFGNSHISAMGYSPVDHDVWYVLTEDGDFFYSVDRGQSFTLTTIIDGPGAHYFYGASIFASESTPGLVYIAGSGYSNPAVFVSSDSGKTFTPIDNGLPNTLVYQIRGTSDDSLVYAATDVGAYVLTVEDDTWHLLSGDAAPDQTYWTVDVVEKQNTVRFGTHGRGIWDFQYYKAADTTDTTNSIPEISDINELSIFPNPFAEFLTFSAGHGRVRNVEIFIYDMKGSLVKQKRIANRTEKFTLSVSSLNPGSYIVQIRNDGNSIRFEKMVKIE